MRAALRSSLRRAPRRAARLALAAGFAGALVGCKTVDEPPPPPKPTVGARLVPTGTTMRGSATFWQVEGGVGMGVDIANTYPGRWRVVIHANGNCTSPNGFSAGPPLNLPGVPSPIMVYVMTNDTMMGGGTFRLPGLALDGPNGVIGRSVVVHAGTLGSLEAVPDVPNDRAACGVIERVKPLF